MKRTERALCVTKPYAQLAKGGGACLIFAHLSMQLILQSWRPKGKPWRNALPKYAPAFNMLLETAFKLKIFLNCYRYLRQPNCHLTLALLQLETDRR